MEISGLLLELYGRIPPLARDVVEGVDLEHLTRPPAPGANTIAWLIWHMGRVEDHHVSELLGSEQLWSEGGWAAGFGLEPDPANTGYGHSPDEVLSVRPQSAELLLEYLDTAHLRAAALIRELTATDLDRNVDLRWDPPVTMAVRLVSVADDCLQHAGQAAYVKGMLGV
ncbi:MAG TPA: DinB family protein [Acidimicrobiales bacterium]|nr:DinB family protein [Acidimicrobiales bacterium]